MTGRVRRAGGQGEFAPATAKAIFLTVLRSMPVRRLISCWEAPLSSNVTTVCFFCSFKTFTPCPLLESRGDDVLSLLKPADYVISLGLGGGF